MTLLESVDARLAAGDEDGAVEAVYAGAYSLINLRLWLTLDLALQTWPVERHPPDVLLSLLTITGLALVRERLPARVGLCERVRRALEAAHADEADGMLQGLA